MSIQLLAREELPLLWTIDRREHIERIYRLQDGELVLEPHDVDVPGWPPGNQEHTLPKLREAFDRGGRVWAAFEGEQLAAGVCADVKKVGSDRDLMELAWLHVGRDHRKAGLGQSLFELAHDFVRSRGAAGLYVSATPTQNTVDFYRRRGCTILASPDIELFALEPEDIHLECRR